MRLAMTLLVRNEADIVEANIRHHLARGVERAFVTDNGSDDGTVEILEALAAEGVVTLTHEPSREFRQGEWVTRLALAAREAGFGWILANDADEFWEAKGGDLAAVLAAGPARPRLVERFNLICAREDLAADDASADWRRSHVWRVRRPVPARPPQDPFAGRAGPLAFYAALPGKVAAPLAGLVAVTDGNHAADMGEGPEAGEPCAEIVIRHVPVRSRARFEASIRAIAEPLEARDDLSPHHSWRHRRWLRMIQADGGPDRALAEALPSRLALLKDRALGRVVRDDVLSRQLTEAGL